MIAQRDTFLIELFERAKKDSDIILLSVDMGAPAIDRWRKELPSQYFDMGISEQNAINFGAGLSRGGKKVFIYFMAVWVFRCFEQLRYSCAMGQNGITIVGNGVGLGYAPAGPAHEPTEDISVMKSLYGIRIFSPSTSFQISKLIDICLEKNSFNYVRLERKTDSELEYRYRNIDKNKFQEYVHLPSVKSLKKVDVVIFSYGYVSGRVMKAIDQINEKEEVSINFYDLQKLWPLDFSNFYTEIRDSKKVLFVEEQSKSGSLYDSFCQFLINHRLSIDVHEVHLPEKYFFENGNQDYLLDNHGFKIDDLKSLILAGK